MMLQVTLKDLKASKFFPVVVPQSGARLLCKGVCAGNANVAICFTSTVPTELWLLNVKEDAQDLGPCELFGFGLGTFADKSVPAARLGASKAIPWLLENDYTLLSHVSDGSKKLRCFAQIAAHTTQQLGVTELTVTDYNVKNKMKDSVTSRLNVCMLPSLVCRMASKSLSDMTWRP